MISRTEAADLPDLQAHSDQQARIAALGLSITQFQKTLPGRSIVERQEPFVLNGILYQGYNQKAVECPEDQATDDELARAHDIDGTKQRILDTRARRLEGTAHAKRREFAERNKIKIAQERDELELILLKRKIKGLDLTEPEPEDPEPDPSTPGKYACSTCGKPFEDSRALNMHKVGSKH